MSDFAMMRQILRLLAQGKVIGIFAEGQRTWDGATLPLIPTTAKLIKLAGVPVVSPILKGAYLTLPRWASSSRRGRVIVEHRIALTAEEVTTLSVAEIHERLVATLRHDDSEWQKLDPRPYVSSRSAEALQLALFWCPECDELNTMKSRGRRFYCKSCGHGVRVSRYGWFASHPDGAAARSRFQTIREWSVAQQQAVARKVSALHPQAPQEVLFQDAGIEYLRGFRTASLTREGVGSLAFARGGVEFRCDDGRLVFFPWDELQGLHVVYRDQLEFYSGGRLCVFRFPAHDTSALKYLICAEELARQRVPGE
jgi:1-acyl-sn-glycerol-3-phosphate acyltransferase